MCNVLGYDNPIGRYPNCDCKAELDTGETCKCNLESYEEEGCKCANKSNKEVLKSVFYREFEDLISKALNDYIDEHHSFTQEQIDIISYVSEYIRKKTTSE